MYYETTMEQEVTATKQIIMDVSKFNMIVKKCLPVIDKKNNNKKATYICITQTDGQIHAAALDGYMISTIGNKLPDNDTTVRISIPTDIVYPKEKIGSITITEEDTIIKLETRTATVIGVKATSDFFNLDLFYPKEESEYSISISSAKLIKLLKTYDKDECLTFEFHGKNKAITINTATAHDIIMPMLNRKERT